MSTRYEDCPRCGGNGIEPGTDDDICTLCQGEQVIEQKPRREEVTEQGSCDHCGFNGPVHVLFDVYTEEDGRENWEHKISLCHSCYNT